MNQSNQRDITLLFSTRIIRLFCYGFLSVVLALYLAETGLNEKMIGLLFTLTLAGDAGITLWLTTHADRLGRRKTLLIGALLMVGAFVLAPLLPRIFGLTGSQAETAPAVLLLIATRSAMALPLGMFAGVLVGYQRQVATAIKRGRSVALLPYTVQTNA